MIKKDFKDLLQERFAKVLASPEEQVAKGVVTFLTEVGNLEGLSRSSIKVQINNNDLRVSASPMIKQFLILQSEVLIDYLKALPDLDNKLVGKIKTIS